MRGGEGDAREWRSRRGESCRGGPKCVKPSSPPAAVGNGQCRARVRNSSCGQIDPAALPPRLETCLGELHATRAGFADPRRSSSVSPARYRRNSSHWTRKPFGVDLVVRHLLPGFKKVDGLGNVRVPHRLRRVHPRLCPAPLQAGHRRAMRAVHMEHREIVAAHARGPTRVDLRDDPARELERRIRRVIGVGSRRWRHVRHRRGWGYAWHRGTTPPEPARRRCRARSANGRAYRG